MKVKSYGELIVWQRAVDLVADVYKLTQAFPRDESYGLTSQMRRAAVSVASNIGEGQGRHSTNEFIHFLGNARGSLRVGWNMRPMNKRRSCWHKRLRWAEY